MLKVTTEKQYQKVKGTLDSSCGCGTQDLTSSNCKGEKGEKGDKGDQGEQGIPGTGSEATPLFSRNAITITHDDIDDKDYIEWGGPLIKNTVIDVSDKTITFQGNTIIYAENLPVATTDKLLYYDVTTGLISIGDAPVVVETIDWHITGNTGTDEAIHFVGTTDDKKLILRTNNTKRFSVNNSYAGLETYTVTDGNPMGAGFFVNAGNAIMHYPGANIGIATGNNNNRSLSALTEGYWNIGIGDKTLDRLTVGTENIAMGYRVGENLINGIQNISIGVNRHKRLTTGSYNTAIGSCQTADDFPPPDSGSFNTALGMQALEFNISGFNNIAIGPGCMQFVSASSYNVSIGQWCINSGTNPEHNVIIGHGAAQNLTNGARNVCVGSCTPFLGNRTALRDNESDNVLIGEWVCGPGGGGNKNVTIGARAGSNHTQGERGRGTRNISFGYSVGVIDNVVSDSLLIGSYVMLPSTTLSGQMNIGNVLYGANLYTGTTVYSSTPTTLGAIGIGVITPTARLHLGASTTSIASLHMNIGVEPVNPFITNGDIWFNGTKPYMRIGGVSKAFLMEGDVVTGPPTEETGTGTNAAAYIHTQVASSSTWNINHNLDELLPSIDIYDAGGFKLLTYTATVIDANNVIINFSGAQTGKAKIVTVGGTRVVDNADGGDANTKYGGGLLIDGGTA